MLGSIAWDSCCCWTEIIGIDEDGADLVTETGTRQRYRRRPLPVHTVSLWVLGSDD
jgi:hypothetical protein